MTLFIAFFAILLIIALAIISGTAAFFRHEYDFRGVDATTFAAKIRECLIQNEIDFQTEEFFKKCKIKKEVVDKHFTLIIEDKSSGEIIFTAGGADKTACVLWEKNKGYPICATTEINKPERTFFVTAGSNQKSQEKIA